MTIEYDRSDDSLWQQFMDALSDEFLKQTGFGIYAHITPLDVNSAYQEFQQHQMPIHHFAHNYVRAYI
ncbi:MAG: hypothetical protein WCI06_01245 [Methylococcaceae bacterium]